MRKYSIWMKCRARLLHSCIHILSHLRVLFRWIVFSMITGGIVGLVGIAFVFGMQFVTELRTEHWWILFGLPIGGCMIVFLYKICKFEKDTGTNTVLSTLHAETEIPARMAPLIFISTLITHLFGGSSGREGAALQIGGSIGNVLGRWFRLDAADRRVVVMCGMSAAFSAVFGTPLAAVFFAMEVGSVGIMYYAALVPCTIASLTASALTRLFPLEQEAYPLLQIPNFSIFSSVKIGGLALCCAGLSVVFCILLHSSGAFLKKKISIPYLRILAASAILILGTLCLRTTDYLGAGMPVILKALEGSSVWYAFLIKMVFTAVTIGAGFKGGEIVPSFFIGATFGSLYGDLLGLSPSLCAAVGMVAVFCGVTNCPVTSLLIAFELFGFEGMPYFLVGIAISYLLSGYYGLYQSQKIMYSKYKTKYINRHTKE